MPSILVIGANPAWQKSVSLPEWKSGEVVRVRLDSVSAAGKGFNCAQALGALGVDGIRLASGVGTDREAWLGACSRASLDVVELPLSGPVRTATTINEADGSVTEMVEEGPAAAPGADRILAEAVDSLGKDDTVVVCGTFPGGFDLPALGRILAKSPARVVADSVPLAKVVLAGSGFRGILKLNRSEWLAATGGSDLEAALEAVLEAFPDLSVLATDGPRGAWFRNRESHLTIPVHRSAPLPVHPIGAGDAYTAGLVAGLVRGLPIPRSLALGAATAFVSCGHPLPSRFVADDVLAELPRIEVRDV